MKKKILLAAIATIFLLAIAATVALANPHGNYATTTNKCKTCHKVHDAPGTYKLLNATAAENACDFCHAPGGQEAQLMYTRSAIQHLTTTSVLRWLERRSQAKA